MTSVASAPSLLSETVLRRVIGALALLGIGVAGYLTYVHYAELSPLCLGAGGGCEKVQTSDQAELAGVPVALLGLVSYVTLLGTALARGDAARMLGALVAIVGFGFSVYLQAQSVLVIEATCQWCITSAVLMTLLAVACVLRLLRS